MFSSELQLSSATAKLFHLKQFAIYGIFCHQIVQSYSNYSSPVYLVKGVTPQAVVHVKIVTTTSDGGSILIIPFI